MGTGVTAAGGVGDGGAGVSAGVNSGFGNGGFFADGVGDVFDFFFADGLGEPFAFFFFAEDCDFFAVDFFFLGDAFGFEVGDFLGVGDLAAVGELLATSSDFSSDESCADTAPALRTLAITSHKQKRTTARLTTNKLSGRLRSCGRTLHCTLVFAAKNCVQFSAEQQQ